MVDKTHGLTNTGFVIKRLEDVKADLEASMLAQFGEINTAPESVAGQLIGVVASPIADLWELAEAVYKSRYAISAEGMSLDDVAAAIGVYRLKATYTRVLAALYGTEGTLVPSGTEASLTGAPTSRFASETATTISKAGFSIIEFTVSTVTNSAAYSIVIDGVTHSITSDASATANEISSALTAALNASALAITATDLAGKVKIVSDTYEKAFAITSNTSNLTITSVASPCYFLSKITGPVAALANTLTVIETPVPGLSSINNPLDGVAGRNEESDAALRLRRYESLRLAGAGAVEAVRARLQNVTNVVAAYVFENATGSVDSAGRPGHSLECVVTGGADADIATTIWNAKPAGIQLFGSTTHNITDSQGTVQPIKFSRATDIYVWLNVVLTLYSEESFPSDGYVQVRDAILSYASENIGIGVDVLLKRLYTPIFSVPGIKDATITRATSATPGGPAGSYLGTDLAIAQFEVARFDSTRIAVS